MDLLDLRIYPDDVLRGKCEPVEKFTVLEAEILERMVLAMRHYGGIGLAGPQVGILKRMIVADIGEGPVKLVNPEIILAEEKDSMRERCLSLPGVEVGIERSAGIRVQSLNEKGKEVKLNLKGLLARVIQHEVDHLNGKLIVDYLSLSEGIKFYATEEKKEKGKNAGKNTF